MAKNVANNCLAFLREIEDIESYVGKEPKKLMSRFIDLDENGDVDEDTKKLMTKLKYEKLQKYLPKSNLYTFKVYLHKCLLNY